MKKSIEDNIEPAVTNEVQSKLDGGYGWMIVLASFLMQASSFGVISGFGVYLEYYQSTTFPNYPTSKISLIGTLAPTTAALSSFFTGRLCDLVGVRICTVVGAIFVVASHILASFSTEVWQLIITQGFIFGLGGSLVYVPANLIITQWFDKYRGLAVGIGTAGSGLGGLLVNVLNAYLLPEVGLAWTLRINGILFGSLLIISAIIIRPNSNQKSTKKLPPFQIRLVLNPRFLLFTTSLLITSFAFLVPVYYLPSYAVHQGLSLQQGATLVAILNGASAVGRVSMGILGDLIGYLNAYLLCLFLSTVLLIMWLFSNSFSMLVAFSLLFGLPYGGFAGGFPSTCASLFDPIHLGTLMGIAYAPTGLGGLLGPPLAGYIFDTTLSYSNLIYYTLALYVASTLLNLILRLLFMPKPNTPITTTSSSPTSP